MNHVDLSEDRMTRLYKENSDTYYWVLNIPRYIAPALYEAAVDALFVHGYGEVKSWIAYNSSVSTSRL